MRTGGPAAACSIREPCLGSEIRQTEGAGGPMDFFLPIFLTMKMTFNLTKFWYGVR